MTTTTIKTIAIGLISTPQRPIHHEALLDTALTTALAAYSASRPLMLSTTIAIDTAPAGTDEQGDYIDVSAALDTGIAYATALTINGEQYKFRLISADTLATVRIYCTLAPPFSIAAWRPAAHDTKYTTWPAHHEAIIALMCASFYLNTVSLIEPDTRRAEMIQAVAASYYGRASSTLQTIS